MKIRGLTIFSALLLSVGCSLIKPKPRDEIQIFVNIQTETPKTYEALGNWTALGSVSDTLAKQLFRGDTLLSGYFRFVYKTGDFRFEIYDIAGIPMAYVVNLRDTFSLFSYPDDLTILTPPDGNLTFIGVGLKPKEFPFLVLLFPEPTSPDSVYYEGGNLIYLVNDKQITLDPDNHRMLKFHRKNVEVTFQDYRKIGRSWRPFFISVRGGFPFQMVERVELKITEQKLNPNLSPDIFDVHPPPTSKTLNLFPKPK